MKVAIVLLALAAVALASNECTDCVNGRRANDAVSPARAVQTRYQAPIRFPCRFDCKQLVTANNNQPLFASCRQEIIAYGGDYFGSERNPGFDINFQCLTPDTYQNFLTSRAKLAAVIEICQNQRHRCRRAGNRSFDTDAGRSRTFPGLPSLADLALRTTEKYYQWYSQFASIRVVNNMVRCPTVYRASRGRGRERCNCDLVNYPELFSSNSPKMPSATSNSFKEASDIPAPVNPYSSYVQGFLGNYTDINPYPAVEGERESLVSQARAVSPVIVGAVHLGCIDDDVDITSDCDDGN